MRPRPKLWNHDFRERVPPQQKKNTETIRFINSCWWSIILVYPVDVMSWGYPPPTNSEIFYEGPLINLHFPLFVGRGYLQVMSHFFQFVFFFPWVSQSVLEFFEVWSMVFQSRPATKHGMSSWDARKAARSTRLHSGLPKEICWLGGEVKNWCRDHLEFGSYPKKHFLPKIPKMSLLYTFFDIVDIDTTCVGFSNLLEALKDFS